ncbi:MAG: hypothetical protein HUJ93_02990 [Bacteroidales bacterium]|nr:hypothetical protein [Bacteroidales bacterium]
MKILNKLFMCLSIAVMAVTAVSCDKSEGPEVSSKDAFFFNENLAFNLTTNPVINIPVVRLGTEGDVTVNVTSAGASNFNVPSQVVIKDGDKVGNIEVTYEKSSLAYNQLYSLKVDIQGFNSIYGYGSTAVTIEYPTSYFQYAKGKAIEDWWAEEEPDKLMFAREYLENIYQCYLPDCWGHDSGAGYPVQDYVFYWNYSNNKVYVPYQFMGSGKTYIADMGAWTCMSSGPNYTPGTPEWFSYIDEFYAGSGHAQPHYDPATKTFYLADGGAIDGSAKFSNPDKYVVE